MLSPDFGNSNKNSPQIGYSFPQLNAKLNPSGGFEFQSILLLLFDTSFYWIPKLSLVFFLQSFFTGFLQLSKHFPSGNRRIPIPLQFLTSRLRTSPATTISINLQVYDCHISEHPVPPRFFWQVSPMKLIAQKWGSRGVCCFPERSLLSIPVWNERP